MSRKPNFGRIFRRLKRATNGSQTELPTWWIAYYRNGKEHRESSRSNKFTDAEALLKLRHTEIAAGRFTTSEAARLPVSRLLDELLADYELNGKAVAWAGYVDGHLRPFFGSMRARDVGTLALQKYVAARRAAGISNATINREFTILRRAFNLGRNADPPLVAHVPKIPRLEENNVRKGFFDHEHFVSLRGELPEHLRPVITFAYYTGCRKGEVLSLRWTQVDLSARVVRLEPGETKNDDARVIPLMGELQEMLAIERTKRDERWPGCPWVFSRYGKRILNFYGAWAEASKRAGLVDESGDPARLFHDLRRTGVRNLIRAGVPERVAMMISGHKSRSVLDRYNIVDERDLRDAGFKLERYIDAQSGRDTDTLRTPDAPIRPDARRDTPKPLN